MTDGQIINQLHLSLKDSETLLHSRTNMNNILKSRISEYKEIISKQDKKIHQLEKKIVELTNKNKSLENMFK